MTVAANNLSLQDHDRYPDQVVVGTERVINQGDLVGWDATNFSAFALTGPTDVAGKFIGVAGGTSPFSLYGTDQGVSDPVPASIPVDASGTFYFSTTAAETYTHFAPVTVGADAQTITTSGVTSSNRVGFVIIRPPDLARASNLATPVSESVVGAAGVRVRVLIEAKHPVAIAL